MAFIKEKKRKDGKISYQVRYLLDGIPKTKTFRTSREANNFKKDIEAKLRLDIAERENNIKFKDYAEMFISVHELSLKRSTARQYRIRINIINEKFGNRRVKDLTPLTLNNYFVELHNKGYKMNTLKKYKDILSLILQAAKREGIVKENSMQNLTFKFTNANEIKVKKTLTEKQVQTLVKSFDMEYLVLVTDIAYLTGLRIGEICALELTDVDFKHGMLYSTKTFNSKDGVTEPKTRSSVRAIPLHKTLKQVVKRAISYVDKCKNVYGDKYNDNNLLVCHFDGRHINPNAVSKRFNEKSKVLGFRVTPHMLRHSFATKSRTIEIKDVQAMVGHAKPETTQDNYQEHDRFLPSTIEQLNNNYKDYLKRD